VPQLRANDAATRDTLLLKPVEVADELRVSPAKVYRLIASRQIPVVRVGASWRVPRAALREWIVARTEVEQ
jgi:excisionase family DNA binding protein